MELPVQTPRWQSEGCPWGGTELWALSNNSCFIQISKLHLGLPCKTYVQRTAVFLSSKASMFACCNVELLAAL